MSHKVPRNIEVQQRLVPSQDVSFLKKGQFEKMVSDYMPIYARIWAEVERQTGHRWKATSFVRMSPSHKTGEALDIAPDISPEDEDKYAVTHMSDPVLYKREPLMRQLQAAVKELPLFPYDTAVVVEPDHLHIGVFEREHEQPKNYLYKWGIVKPVYGDSFERQKLPMMYRSY